MLDADERARKQREELNRIKREAKAFRADVQAVMALPEVRRIVWRFLSVAGVDSYAYRQKPHDMVVAAAMQDNARWWLEVIREHCPEREAQMRAEARKAERDAREGDDNEAEDE